MADTRRVPTSPEDRAAIQRISGVPTPAAHWCLIAREDGATAVHLAVCCEATMAQLPGLLRAEADAIERELARDLN